LQALYLHICHVTANLFLPCRDFQTLAAMPRACMRCAGLPPVASNYQLLLVASSLRKRARRQPAHAMRTGLRYYYSVRSSPSKRARRRRALPPLELGLGFRRALPALETLNAVVLLPLITLKAGASAAAVRCRRCKKGCAAGGRVEYIVISPLTPLGLSLSPPSPPRVALPLLSQVAATRCNSKQSSQHGKKNSRHEVA